MTLRPRLKRSVKAPTKVPKSPSITPNPPERASLTSSRSSNHRNSTIELRLQARDRSRLVCPYAVRSHDPEALDCSRNTNHGTRSLLATPHRLEAGARAIRVYTLG